jgi:2-hydroxy-6-oxonona-2,4-dienedioate hydrolase
MDEQRYSAAERALWDDAHVDPLEHRVHLPRLDVDVRVLEVGEGPSVLFLHGGPGAAAPIWAYLAARLLDFRCLLLDRPGTGLSEAHPLDGPAAIRNEGEILVADVFDALGVDRGHLVGSSHGSYVALHSAATHPGRVDRTMHLGCPGFVEGMVLRGFDRVVLLPGAARVFGRLPANAKSMRSAMHRLGHRAADDDGKISQSFIEWGVALQRDTATMRNELATMAGMGTFRRGFYPELTIDRGVLEQVASPTYVLWGDNDPYGDERIARQLVAALPDAQLEMLPSAGHLCWFDEVDRVADRIRSHLLDQAERRPNHTAATI